MHLKSMNVYCHDVGYIVHMQIENTWRSQTVQAVKKKKNIRKKLSMESEHSWLLTPSLHRLTKTENTTR